MKFAVFSLIIIYIVINNNIKQGQALECGLSDGNDHETVRKIANTCTKNQHSNNKHHKNNKNYNSNSNSQDDDDNDEYDEDKNSDENDEYDEDDDSASQQNKYNNNKQNDRNNKNNRNNKDKRSGNNNNNNNNNNKNKNDHTTTTTRSRNLLTRPRSKRQTPGHSRPTYSYSSWSSERPNYSNMQGGGQGGYDYNQNRNGYNSQQYNPYNYQNNGQSGHSGQSGQSMQGGQTSSGGNRGGWRNSNQMSDNRQSGGNSNNNTDQCQVISCILGQLRMTDRQGYPDRGLVSQALTKNVRNMELRNFLQESTDDCFELLHEDHKKDACEYSNHLINCLAEKGRNNCDDWQEQNLNFT